MIEHYIDETVRAILGLGDVVVSPSVEEIAHVVIGELIIANSPCTKPVGGYLSDEEAAFVNVDNPNITLNFHNTESIDVLIKNLLLVKTMMQIYKPKEDKDNE